MIENNCNHPLLPFLVQLTQNQLRHSLDLHLYIRNPFFHISYYTKVCYFYHKLLHSLSYCLILSMATSCSTSLLVFLFAIFSTLTCCSVASNEFQVGDSNGWAVPPQNDTNFYNEWASHNRFHAGDTLWFKYKKDSVMEVDEGDYTHCNATHPKLFSNSGNTKLKLGHPGTFYFMSGASGHCEVGQKMIVRVMVDESLPQHAKSSGYHIAISPTGLSQVLFFQFLLASFLGSLSN
ncbi:early nodulin-like protein 1 [Vigna angularis]|nr:early nodulin-like protein 1 [Vigna angularis]